MSKASTSAPRPKALHIGLWVAQVLMAGMFLMVGIMKTFTPIAELAVNVPLAAQNPGLVRFIGISELLAAIGLILPSALRIAPALTVWAARGLTVIMVLAFLYHLIEGHYTSLPVTVVLGSITYFIAWGRNGKAAITEGNVFKKQHQAGREQTA